MAKKLLAFTLSFLMVFMLLPLTMFSALAIENPITFSAGYINGYDNAADKVYAFASESNNIIGLSGQLADTFDWFYKVLMEQTDDGNFVVINVEPAGTDRNEYSTWTLGADRIAFIAHSTDTDGFAALSAMEVGQYYESNNTLENLMDATAQALSATTFTQIDPPVVDNSSDDPSNESSDESDDTPVQPSGDITFVVTEANNQDQTVTNGLSNEGIFIFASGSARDTTISYIDQNYGGLNWWVSVRMKYDSATSQYEVVDTCAPQSGVADETWKSWTYGEQTDGQYIIVTAFTGSTANADLMRTVTVGQKYTADRDYATITDFDCETLDSTKIVTFTLVDETEPDPENKDAKYTAELFAPTCYGVGDKLVYTVSITDITADTGVSAVSFTIVYDNTKLKLVSELDESNNNGVDCLVAAPAIEDSNTAWENLTHVAHTVEGGVATALNDGNIYVSALTTSINPENFAVNDGELKFSFEFEVLEGAEGDIAVSIPNDSVTGLTSTSNSYFTYVGNGSSTTVGAHTGGTANCESGAACDLCGKEYGEKDPTVHTQDAAWTTQTATHHEKTYPCCGAVAVEEAEHSWEDGVCTVCGYVCEHVGGTATCKEQATCTVCGEKYGDLDPDNHEEEAVWTTQTATNHEKTYPCCGAVAVANAEHSWEDGVCTVCGYGCKHVGGTATCKEQATCTVCGEKYGDLDPDNHEGALKWTQTATTHKQAYDCCGETVVEEAAHTWEDGVCTVCDYECEHTGGTANCESGAVCDICKKEYTDKNPENHVGALKWTQTATTHKQAYDCCGETVVEEAAHTWEDGVCTVCDYECEHTGGTANCESGAVCDICKKEYTDKNPENHTGKLEWTQTATTHKQAWTCCGATVVAEEGHDWDAEGECTECGYGCVHVEGTPATCTSPAICEKCGQTYGDVNPDAHTGTEEWTKDAETHSKAWTCCHKVTVEEAAHTWKDGVCTVCDYVCEHEGGEATCLNKAECEICGEEYGTTNPDNHTGTLKWTQTATTHKQAYDCCGAVEVAEAEHSWKDGVCTVCGYVCEHEGGEATCLNKAECEICGEEYGTTNPDNHTGTLKWTQTATTHKQAYDCCGETVVAEAAHTWKDGVCTVCDYVCEHEGGEATCLNKAECEICGEEYGDLDPDNHEGTLEWIKTETTHKQAWTCCGATVVEEEGHDWVDGVCSECGYACEHDEGEWVVVTEPKDGENGLKELRCTICGKVLDTEEIAYLLIGDANLDGVVDGLDYLLVKRHVMGTYTLEGEALDVADVDRDGDVDSYDYLLLKRSVLGTYVIPQA